MNFDIDIAIVIGFLVLNLSVGLYYGRGVRSIKDYALGGRSFSTPTLVATIVATWISGSIFAVSLSQSYAQGIYFIPSAIGHCINLFIVAWIFVPRMAKFLGDFSVAETMGNLFGKKVRIISAIAAIGKSVGSIALQIKVFATIFNYFLGIHSEYAVFISSFIVISYSAFGGIRAVTFTDVLQLATFSTFIPIFCIFIWQVYGDSNLLMNTVLNVSSTTNSSLSIFEILFIFLYFLIPSLNPAMFQRTLIGKNVEQVRLAFNIAALISIVIMLLACFIGLVILSNEPSLDPSNVFMYTVDHYSFPILKGLVLVGIMAMIMSTADSWINSSAVLFSHDICKPLGIFKKNELVVSRLFSLIVGIIAILLVLSTTGLFKLILLQANFYMPIVTAPLMLGLLGFRSSEKIILIGIFTGFLTVLVWKTFIFKFTNIDSVIPGFFANLISTISFHYLLRAPSGWTDKVNIKKSLLLTK